MVAVRHGDGTVVTQSRTRKIVEAIREHADRLPEVIDTRDALETKIAALAASRRTDEDLARIDSALEAMAADIEAGGRGVEGDERFHGAVTTAAHSLLLARLMDEISDLIKETRIESLSQPDRPRASLAGHRAIAEAIRASDPDAASEAMHAHVAMVSDVALLREPPTRDGLRGSSPYSPPASAPASSPPPSGSPPCSASPCCWPSGCRPVVANASNTVGLTPAALSGSFGYRRELREHPRITVAVLVTCAVGSVAGAVAPAGAAARRLRGRRAVADPGDQRPGRHPALAEPACCARAAARTCPTGCSMSPTTAGWATLTGVYGGYFGAGSGVMMMAVLGFGLDLELRIVNALKTLAVMAANVVATVIFLFLADLDWLAIGLLAGGSVVGGYVGSHIGRRLPPTVLRVARRARRR